MINTKVRKALIRGTAVTLLTVIMASAAVGCGKKEEPASQVGGLLQGRYVIVAHQKGLYGAAEKIRQR